MNHQVHFPILSQLGLNQSEALVYELLLELGPKNAQELVTPSGLGRGNVYNVLTSLISKGLVIEEDKKKTIYKAVDPEVLRGLAQQKMTSAESLFQQLEVTLPSLKSHYSLITKKPTIRFFEGEKGIKELHKEMLREGKPILAIVGPDAPPKNLDRWLRTVYVNERVKRGIPVAGFTTNAEGSKELLQTKEKELRTAAVLSQNEFPLASDINVFGNCVALIDYKIDRTIGIIIESEALAKTLASTIRAVMAFKGIHPPF